MQELAKQFGHTMNTYTEEQLCSFGNFLLKHYEVNIYSSDGKGPIYQREVSHTDMRNWQEENPLKDGSLPLPSQFVHGDAAKFCCMPDDPSIESFPGIPCEILAVHFYPGKVKYDLDLIFVDNQRSRIYNVDSVLVLPRS